MPRSIDIGNTHVKYHGFRPLICNGWARVLPDIETLNMAAADFGNGVDPNMAIPKLLQAHTQIWSWTY